VTEKRRRGKRVELVVEEPVIVETKEIVLEEALQVEEVSREILGEGEAQEEAKEVGEAAIEAMVSQEESPLSTVSEVTHESNDTLEQLEERPEDKESSLISVAADVWEEVIASHTDKADEPMGTDVEEEVVNPHIEKADEPTEADVEGDVITPHTNKADESTEADVEGDVITPNTDNADEPNEPETNEARPATELSLDFGDDDELDLASLGQYLDDSVDLDFGIACNTFSSVFPEFSLADFMPRSQIIADLPSFGLDQPANDNWIGW